MTHPNLKFAELLSEITIVPVITINDIDDAIPMAEALVAGGLTALEVTLRSECAFAAIEKMIKHVPEAMVGVGTVNDAEKYRKAEDLGATFAVSPGTTIDLIKAAEGGSLPLLPGVATASEAMQMADHGYQYLKMFPAQAIGGTALLKSWAGPLPDLKFCPTGGVNLTNALDYLNCPNVVCVGGSWMLPKEVIAVKDWAEITKLASSANQLSAD